jgi:hypothetical protein
LNAIAEDWSGFGASGHVVWFEETVEKTPDTLVLGNTGTGQSALARLLLALRLHKEGDLGLGAVFNAEYKSFSLRGGGLSRTVLGGEGSGFGDKTYVLAASEAPQVRSVYDSLVQLDQDSDVPPNVRLAFRRFGSIYGRGLGQREDRIPDSVTALEALLGAKDELTFKLSFRVASILASDDEERAELLLEMKKFYGARSRIVHGGELRQQHLDLVADDAALRDIVRRVLRGVLHLAVEHGKHLTRRFVDEELDGILVHTENRETLRRAMGLTG